MRDWLISLRESSNLTQQSVADSIGVTRQMISAIENGTATPSVGNAKSLAKLLNFSWTKFYEQQDAKTNCSN